MKTVLVTGGARGIGRAIVEQFANNGFTVIINYNKSKEQATELATNLRQKGCDVHTIFADVSCESDVISMCGYIERYFKKIDVLINNAGVALYGMLESTTTQQYDTVMNTNAKGAFLVTKYCLPLLRKSVKANIVNVSSIWGVKGASCESVYSMSKFALVGLTLSLSEELDGINVNCICPPIVMTDMVSKLSSDDIQDFCKLHGVEVLMPQFVAEKVFELVHTDISGQVLQL